VECRACRRRRRRWNSRRGTAPWDGRTPITIVGAGGAKLRVERVHADGRISGRLDGHRFTVEPATGTAGLVERDGARRVVLADGSIRGTMIPTRPPRCRVVLVTSSSGQQQWVTVC
jgi:hypothetical protein